MRLGIFGGSFDPVHNGHLTLARCCQDQATLDEIWFTPTAVQPLKQHGPTASDADRVAMLELAMADEPSWHISKIEIDRGGLSYTVDTLRAIHAARPDDELFFLMGADAVADVPHWREPAEIFKLTTPLVVHRAGQSLPDLSIIAPHCPPPHAPQLIDMPATDISSTEIRRRAAERKRVDAFVPKSVAEYIVVERVY